MGKLQIILKSSNQKIKQTKLTVEKLPIYLKYSSNIIYVLQIVQLSFLNCFLCVTLLFNWFLTFGKNLKHMFAKLEFKGSIILDCSVSWNTKGHQKNTVWNRRSIVISIRKRIVNSKIFVAVDGNGSGLPKQQTERSQGENKKDFENFNQLAISNSIVFDKIVYFHVKLLTCKIIYILPKEI